MQFYQFMAKTLLTFLFLFFTSIIFAQVNTLRDALVLKTPQANTYTTTGISDYINKFFLLIQTVFVHLCLDHQ